MMREQLTYLRLLAFVGSVGVHAGAFAALGAAEAPEAQSIGPTAVDFQVVAPAAPPEVPPPVEALDDPEPQAPAALAPPPAAPAEPAPQDEPPPEPADTSGPEPVDLTGVTLTGDGSGAGWASVVGDGSAMAGPLGRLRTRPAREEPKSVPAPTSRPGASGRAIKPALRPPEEVAVSDLSRRPSPPSLAGVLESNYPPEARRQGIGGEAMVSARVESNGSVRAAQIVSESAPGFGQACVRTLVGSSWTPPLSQEGQPVATRIHYTCRFRVSR